jgi:hypothetical protein
MDHVSGYESPHDEIVREFRNEINVEAARLIVMFPDLI